MNNYICSIEVQDIKLHAKTIKQKKEIDSHLSRIPSYIIIIICLLLLLTRIDASWIGLGSYSLVRILIKYLWLKVY